MAKKIIISFVVLLMLLALAIGIAVNTSAQYHTKSNNQQQENCTEHKYIYLVLSNENHYKQCIKCNKTKTISAHSFTEVIATDGINHILKCKDCTYEINEKCTYSSSYRCIDNKTHSKICSCGKEISEFHKITLNNSTGKMWCSICQEEFN